MVYKIFKKICTVKLKYFDQMTVEKEPTSFVF